MIRNEYRKTNSDRITKIQEDKTGKQIWNHVKKAAGWVITLSPVTININGNLTTNCLVISNQLNNFFIDKVKKIGELLGPVIGDPNWVLKESMDRWAGAQTMSPFVLKNVQF